MASIHTAARFQTHLANKKPLQMARLIIDELIGYRSSSRHKPDDIDTLSNAIEAIIALSKEQK